MVPLEGLEPPTHRLRIVLLFRWTLLHASAPNLLTRYNTLVRNAIFQS